MKTRKSDEPRLATTVATLFLILAITIGEREGSRNGSSHSSSSCGVVNAATDKYPYSDYEKNYYDMQHEEISTALSPCGCLSRNVTEDLVPPNLPTAPTYLNQQVLFNAEKGLLHQLAQHLGVCGCNDGINIVNAVKVRSPAKPDELEAKSQADIVYAKTAQLLNLTMDRCCSPQSSEKTYAFVAGKFTFEAAVADATKKGGRIATINSRYDSMAAFGVIKDKSGPVIGDGMFSWVGAKKDAAAGSLWEWVSSSAWTFSNWGFGRHASNAGCGSVAMTTWTGTTSSGGPGQWSSHDCGSELPYIVEMVSTQGGTPPSPAGGDNMDVLVIVIGVLLGLFIIASVAIVARKMCAPYCGGNVNGPRRTMRSAPEGASPRRAPPHQRRGRLANASATRNLDQNEGDAEMTDIRTAPGVGGPQQRIASGRRRVQFTQSSATGGARRTEAGSRTSVSQSEVGEEANSPRTRARQVNTSSFTIGGAGGSITSTASVGRSSGRATPNIRSPRIVGPGAAAGSALLSQSPTDQSASDPPSSVLKPQTLSEAMEMNGGMLSLDGSVSFDRHPSLMSADCFSVVSGDLMSPRSDNPAGAASASAISASGEGERSPLSPPAAEDPMSFLDALPPASPDRRN